MTYIADWAINDTYILYGICNTSDIDYKLGHKYYMCIANDAYAILVTYIANRETHTCDIDCRLHMIHMQRSCHIMTNWSIYATCITIDMSMQNCKLKCFRLALSAITISRTNIND